MGASGGVPVGHGGRRTIGISGTSVPYPEQMVALSGLGLGLMVVFRVRMAFWAAAMLVAVFALFHGYSHGREMPRAADAASFAIGFVVATGLLHLLGISIGVVDRSRTGQRAIQGAGIAIASVGGFFVVTTFRAAGGNAACAASLRCCSPQRRMRTVSRRRSRASMPAA